MTNLAIRRRHVALALLTATAIATVASAQSDASTGTIRTVEAATTLTNGICSNDVVGISLKLPADMQQQDATSLKEDALRNSSAGGIGPEARYFLWGYRESRELAILCGAKNSDFNRVLVVAAPSTALAMSDLNLEGVIRSFAQIGGAQPTSVRHETIDGHDFVRADAAITENPATHEKMDLRCSFYGVEANSYVVLWTLVGDSQNRWQRLVNDMTAVRITTPTATAKLQPPNASGPGSARELVAPDFQGRLSAFLKAWLQARDRSQTLAFIDPTAYDARPFIGGYCSGWYRSGDRHEEVARAVAANLMGFPAQFPRDAPASALFKASERFPPQWLGSASNDVSADGILVARLTADSLSHIFSGVFAQSEYASFLRDQVQKSGPGYWVVFPGIAPDGDVFVIFTLWLKTDGTWAIKHVDAICQ